MTDNICYFIAGIILAFVFFIAVKQNCLVVDITKIKSYKWDDNCITCCV